MAWTVPVTHQQRSRLRLPWWTVRWTVPQTAPWVQPVQLANSVMFGSFELGMFFGWLHDVATCFSRCFTPQWNFHILRRSRLIIAPSKKTHKQICKGGTVTPFLEERLELYTTFLGEFVWFVSQSYINLVTPRGAGNALLVSPDLSLLSPSELREVQNLTITRTAVELFLFEKCGSKNGSKNGSLWL